MELFKAVGNTQGDGFGCFEDDNGTPRVLTKQEWIDQLNYYQEADGYDTRYTLEDWDNLDDWDMRGIILEPVATK